MYHLWLFVNRIFVSPRRPRGRKCSLLASSRGWGSSRLSGRRAQDAATIPNRMSGVTIFAAGSPTAPCDAAAPVISKSMPA